MQTHASGMGCAHEVLLIGCPLGSSAAEMVAPILGGVRQLISGLAPPRCAIYFDEKHAWPERHSPACTHQGLLDRLSRPANSSELKSLFEQREHCAVENCLAAMLQDLGSQGASRASIILLDDGNHPAAAAVFLPPLCKLVRRLVASGHLRIACGGLAPTAGHAVRVRRAALDLGVAPGNVSVSECLGSLDQRRAVIEEVLAKVSQALKPV